MKPLFFPPALIVLFCSAGLASNPKAKRVLAGAGIVLLLLGLAGLLG